MRSFTVEERRARLARRHRLAPPARAPDVESATEAMVCLHATDPATVYLSAWARVDEMTTEDLDRALYADRTLVKHLAMRRTLFVFPRGLVPAVQAGASGQVAASERKRIINDVEKAGLFADASAWFASACAAVLEALADGREATWSELREEIPLLQGSTRYAEGKPWGGEVPVGPRVLTALSAGGEIVRASNRASWTASRPRWAAFAAWLGRPIASLPEAAARAQLVRRWLEAFGPATLQDIKWWFGSTVRAVRAALDDVEAVEVDLHGHPGVALADDLGSTAPVDPWAALLPALDPTTMGWQERDWYLGDHRHRLFDRSGNAGATAWWDGRIVGGWHQPVGSDVVVEVFEDVGGDARFALEAEAERLTKWLDGVRISPRFPSPFAKSRRS